MMAQNRSLPEAENESALKEFVETRLGNFVRWDLIRFFHDNPHVSDTAENIARYTGRDARPVEAELDAMAADALVRVQHHGERAVYSLSHDPTMRELIGKFVLACDDRNFRVQAINHVIRASR